MCLADTDFESFQVYFAYGPFINMGVDVIPVVFLVIESEMLDGGPCALMLLHAAGIRRRAPSGDQGIFGIVFKVPPAQRIPVNVHPRRQPEVRAEFLHLTADNIPGRFHGFIIPCLCKKGCDRNGCRILIIILRVLRNLRFRTSSGNQIKRRERRINHIDPALFVRLEMRCQPQAGRSVGQNQVAYAPVFQQKGSRIARGSRAGRGGSADLRAGILQDASPRRADAQCCHFKGCQLADQLVQRCPPALHVRHGNLLCFGRFGDFLRRPGVGSPARLNLPGIQTDHRSRLFLAFFLRIGVGFHTRGGHQLHFTVRRQQIPDLEGDFLFVQLQGKNDFCIAGMDPCTHIIGAGFQNPRRPGRIIGSHGRCFKPDRQGFRSSRRQFLCFRVCGQLLVGFFQFPRRRRAVNLNHLPARKGSGVRHADMNGDFPFIRFASGAFNAESRVGQTVPERILRGDIECVEIPVSDIYPFRIVLIVRVAVAMAESGG